MEKNKSLRKILAIGIIIIFLGSTITPSINANASKASNDNMVDITIEICGIKEIKPYTVQIATEEAQELEIFFEVIRSKLNVTKSRDETISILNEAVVSLHNKGLLPESVDVNKIQRLISNGNPQIKNIEFLNERIRKNTKISEENLLCHIVGKATNTNFGRLAFIAFLFWLDGMVSIPPFDIIQTMILSIYIMSAILYLPSFILWLICSLFNVGLREYIAFGEFSGGLPPDLTPSEGWIWTEGLNGIKNWTGEFSGDIVRLLLIGALGFTGIKLDVENGCTYILGYAQYVRLN